MLRETSVAAALLSERDPFRSAEHARRGPREYGTVRSRSDVVDRVFALQAFHAGVAAPIRRWSCIRAVRANVLRAAEQLFHLADFPWRRGPTDPELALMQALFEAFPDRLAKLRAGTQDRALMVGGRGVRIDAGSRVRGEPLFLAIELNDAGGEARARMASAVDARGFPTELLDTREEIVLQSDERQVEARLRTYWVDLMLEETPVRSAMRRPRPKYWHSRRGSSSSACCRPPTRPPGSFLARVRWLAEAMPDLGAAVARR